MEPSTIGTIALLFLAYSLISGRLTGSILTAPVVFIALGWLLGQGGFSVLELGSGHTGVHLIAELTLILLLFTDAARIDTVRLRRDHTLPLRMLLVGLPLAIVSGAILAWLVFPDFGLWQAALLAALLAPTDAALGQSVVSAKAVPVRIRQAINVESGLNDGIALPAVLLFASLAGQAHHAGGAEFWITFVMMQLVLGPVTGIVIGYVGARLTDTCATNGWMGSQFQGIAILALALLTYVVAEWTGGNGFIAAFVGGLVFGRTIRHGCEFLFEFMETEGNLLMLLTFLVFGAVLLPEAIGTVTPAMWLYAGLSLTVIRMIPIAVSLIGSGVRLPTHLFLGWFGPRGLASILFVLLILDEAELSHQHEIFTVTMLTVALSALLHGITAAPFALRYGQMAAAMGECEENQATSELPLRQGPVDTTITKEFNT